MEMLLRLPFGSIGFGSIGYYNDGSVSLVAEDLFMPNGLALSTDKKWVERTNCIVDDDSTMYDIFPAIYGKQKTVSIISAGYSYQCGL